MGSVFENPTLKKRYIPKNVKHEENLQLTVCKYLRMQFPAVMFRSDYASGLKLTMHQAAKHKRLQSGRAWPDLFIYLPRKVAGKQYAGMALELKKEGTAIMVTRGPRKGQLVSNEHITEQYYLLQSLRKVGYFAEFACGLDDAIDLINKYMGVVEPEPNALF